MRSFRENHSLYSGAAEKIYAVTNIGPDTELKLRLENLNGKVGIDIYDQDKNHLKNMTVESDFEYDIVFQEGHTYYFRISLANGMSGSSYHMEFEIWKPFTVELMTKRDFFINAGEKVFMQIKAKGDHPEGFRYQWYAGSKPIEGETADSISIVVEKNTYCHCEVRNDYYPGYSHDASFSISVENDLKADSGETRVIRPGTEVIMRANASCRNGNIHYTWIDEGTHGYTEDDQVLPESGDTLKRVITKDSRFTLEVRDDYGNLRVSQFEYTVSNTAHNTGLNEIYYLKKGAQTSIGNQSLKADSYKWTVCFEDDLAEYVLDHSAPVLKIRARRLCTYVCDRTVKNTVIRDTYDLIVDRSPEEKNWRRGLQKKSAFRRIRVQAEQSIIILLRNILLYINLILNIPLLAPPMERCPN